MKFTPFLLFVLLIIFALTGCIKNDRINCPDINPFNLKLDFIYVNILGKDIFKEHIDYVHIFIYDEDYKLFQQNIVNKNELNKKPSTEFYLPRGKYYIVCWGNALYRTKFINVTDASSLADAYLENSLIDIDRVAPNGDPLYFAPTDLSAIEVIIPKVGQVVQKVPFISAHVAIKVYVKGFDDHFSNGNHLEPVLELSNIPDKYNFQLETSNTFIKYKHIAEYELLNDKKIAFVQFNTPLFDEDTQIELTLKKVSTNEILTTIYLSEFILQNKIELTGVDQVVIPIMIEFKDASVAINLPNWGNVPIDPEL